MIYSHLLYIFLILLGNLYKMKGKVSCNVFNHSKECTILLENVATTSANFISCTLQNSRPVQICCSCATAYSSVLESYQKIVQSQKFSNSTCDEKLLNQDKLEVIETTITFFNNLWSKGRCSNCLNESTNKTDEQSNITKEFKKFNFDTNQCLANFYDPSNKAYSSEVCQNCSTFYYKLNKFYSNLKENVGNGNICMDIVDTMNITQHLWSNVLHCGKTKSTIEIPLITLTSIIFFFPLILYSYSFKYTSHLTKPSAVLRRNRLSQRFGERWRNRAGSSISN